MEQEIIQCEEAFLQAMRTIDLKTIEVLLHDDLIYNNFMGEVLDKEMDLAGAKSGSLVMDTVDCLDRKIQVFGDTAIVSTAIYMKGSFKEYPIDGKTRFLRTWKKFEAGWQIIGAASVALQ